MLFVVQFEDVYAGQPERLPERQQHMPAHLAFLAQHPDQVVAAGALRSSQEGTPLGGIWIVNAPDQAAVETLYQADPFWTAGLRRSVHVNHWAKAFWSPGFTDCMSSFGMT